MGLIAAALAAAETPIPQPISYGWDFAGPALQLACVAELKRLGPDKFVESVTAKSPDERVVCVRQLLQNLSPEPEFTAHDYFEWWKQPLDNSARSLRMQDRLGVNLNAAAAILALAKARLITDRPSIAPLIRCLAHPLLDVSRVCEDSLVTLTRHNYGWKFYHDSPPAPTFDSRQRMIDDWSAWSRQMQDGVPIFDQSLEAECASAVSAVGSSLERVFQGSVAASYLEPQVLRHSFVGFGGEWSAVIFDHEIGTIAANWSDRTTERIAIILSRPGIQHAQSKASSGETRFFPASPPGDKSQNYAYSQTFPALDLEMRVEVTTKDPFLARACSRALLEGSDGLRRANASAR